MRNRYRKRAYYKGDLARPVVSETASDLSKVNELFPVEVAAFLRERNSRLLTAQFVGTFGKLSLLCTEFGIDSSRPGWARDLALSLARRHLPERFAGPGVDYSSLFTIYGLDPHALEADFSLALKLAFDHVPGFAIRAPVRPKGPLATIDFVRFALAVVTVQEHLRDTPRGASNRHVAETLLDARRLKRILSPGEIKEITRILRSAGNLRRGQPGRLSETALRKYLREMREAWRAYSEARATPFQAQFVEEVLPIAYDLSTGRDFTGQN
jgi:hypothetical protein